MPSTRNDEIAVGRIAGVFGIRGELKCDPTNAARSTFTTGSSFRAQLRDGASAQIVLSGVREHKNRILIRLQEVYDADQAQRFAGALLYAPASRIILQPGEYFDRDLAGCELFGTHGEPLGKVERVEHYPASDMLVVGGKLVPMVRAFIKSIDTNSKKIIVDLPPGLLDEESADRA